MSSRTASRTAPARRTRSEGDSSKELTSAKIAAHVDAFRASGGKIEVLGTTRVLTRVDDTAPPAVKSR